MQAQEFIGLDIGGKKIGVARGNSIAKIAEPLLTIDSDQAFDQLKEILARSQAAGVVVGLPRNLGGDDTAQTALVRQWVQAAQAEIKLPFYWQDEALTSVQSAKTKDEDAHAAAIILQDFLNRDEKERVNA